MTEIETIEQPEPQAVAPLSESASMLALIERAARDPSVDIDKMERLFQMHERVEGRHAEAAFNTAMAAAQSKIGPVIKNKKNTHTGSEYADLYAIADAALPVAHEHGFGLSFSECPPTVSGCMGIACEVTHSGGHSKRYTYNIPLDKAGSQGKVNKTDTQAYGSTMTYGRRYATCGVFNIAITDKDGNKAAQNNEPLNDEQELFIRTQIDATKTDINAFLRYIESESISDIPQSRFPRAKAMLAKKAQQVKP